jgi:hypothetical protein
MRGLSVRRSHSLSLVIVCNPDFFGIVSRPLKNDPVLIVDAIECLPARPAVQCGPVLFINSSRRLQRHRSKRPPCHSRTTSSKKRTKTLAAPEGGVLFRSQLPSKR